jgi:hypothetical protein
MISSVNDGISDNNGGGGATREQSSATAAQGFIAHDKTTEGFVSRINDRIEDLRDEAIHGGRQVFDKLVNDVGVSESGKEKIEQLLNFGQQCVSIVSRRPLSSKVNITTSRTTLWGHLRVSITRAVKKTVPVAA